MRKPQRITAVGNAVRSGFLGKARLNITPCILRHLSLVPRGKEGSQALLVPEVEDESEMNEGMRG